eukprot:492229_1
MTHFEISLCNGELNGFIWSVDDANKLRTKYKILGNFNSHISKQNDQNKKKKINDQSMIIGLPFILNQFEIRLCFELNIASIVYQCIDKNRFKTNNNNSNTNTSNNNNKHDIMYEFFIQNNLKRLESLNTKCKYQSNKSEIESSFMGQKRTLKETDIIENKDECKWENIKQLKLLSTPNIINNTSLNKHIHISPAQDFILFPKQLFDVYSFNDMSNKYNSETFWSKLFNFNVSSNKYVIFDEQYRVYRDLYDNGFHILMDRRFSGNFILYEQSPSLSTETKIHSKYIVQIISKYDKNYKLMLNILDKYCKQTMEYDNSDMNRDTKLLELDIMIMCFVRVAVIVKKHMLFGYIDSETNEVKYYIVKWHYQKKEAFESKTEEIDDNTEKEMWYQIYNNYKPSCNNIL